MSQKYIIRLSSCVGYGLSLYGSIRGDGILALSFDRDTLSLSNTSWNMEYKHLIHGTIKTRPDNDEITKRINIKKKKKN